MIYCYRSWCLLWCHPILPLFLAANFPGLPQLLALLNDLKYPTIVYGDGLDENMLQQFSSSTMHFEHQPLDMSQVGQECDLAILNGNHGTAVALDRRQKVQIQAYLSAMAQNLQRVILLFYLWLVTRYLYSQKR